MLAFLRRAKNPNDSMVVVCNFTPVVRENYRIGVPTGGFYREVLNTDAESTAARTSATRAAPGRVPEPYAGRPFHLSLRLPPLGVLYLKTPSGDREPSSVAAWSGDQSRFNPRQSPPGRARRASGLGCDRRLGDDLIGACGLIWGINSSIATFQVT